VLLHHEDILLQGKAALLYKGGIDKRCQKVFKNAKIYN
jgi:hypothetical protein